MSRDDPNPAPSPRSTRLTAIGIMAGGLMEVARGARVAGRTVPSTVCFAACEGIAAEWLDHDILPGDFGRLTAERDEALYEAAICHDVAKAQLQQARRMAGEQWQRALDHKDNERATSRILIAVTAEMDGAQP